MKQTNQYTPPDPRQIEFLKYYLDKKGDTFSNALKSAIKAGYSQEYAENIMSLMPKWLSEAIDELKDTDLIRKAEKNIDTFLDGDDEKIKADITKFVLSRLNKKKYSDRIEHTGENGEELTFVIKRHEERDTR